jgi:hypothetical protein
VNDVLAGVEHGRVDQHILTQAKGAPSSVGRPHDAELAPALGHAETLLLVAGFESSLRCAQTDLEDYHS